MKQEKILNILGQVDEKFIEEAAPAKLVMESPAVMYPFRIKGKIKTVLITSLDKGIQPIVKCDE